MAEATVWKPIKIDGFSKGIGSSPDVGFGDMRNVNITTIPGEATLGYKSHAMNIPPSWIGVSATVVAATDTFTVVSFPAGTIVPGTAIRFTSIGTATGINTTDAYYISVLSSTTFKVYTNPNLNVSNLVNVTADGTVVFNTIPFAGAIDSTNYISNSDPRIFVLATDGRVWQITTGGFLKYLGNTTLTSTNNQARSIEVYHGYIIVFRRLTMDAFPISVLSQTTVSFASQWTYGFQAITDSKTARRASLVGQDDIIYFANTEQDVASLEAVGTFDPTSAPTWTYNASALDIPTGLGIPELGEIGTYLLVGTSGRFIYPWDRVSPSFIDPLILPEFATVRIVSTNQFAFIFAGDRGNIYITNGSTLELYEKVPDNVTGAITPLFTWRDACIMRNQLYFTFTTTSNGDNTAPTDLATTAGAWAIDIPSKVLRNTNKPSYGDYSGITDLIIANTIDDPVQGNGIFTCYSSVQNVQAGGDYLDTTLSSDYSVTIDSPMFTVGDFLQKRTFRRIDVVLNQPLTATQGVKLLYRYGLQNAYTLIGTFEGTDANFLGRYGFTTNANIQDAVVVQLQIQIKGQTYFCVKEVTLH